MPAGLFYGVVMLESAANTLAPTVSNPITGLWGAQMQEHRAFAGWRARCSDLRVDSALCYKRHMRELREWISEKMRRRPRRGPNDSESTGKSGQELPANQPAPLRPAY